MVVVCNLNLRRSHRFAQPATHSLMKGACRVVQALHQGWLPARQVSAEPPSPSLLDRVKQEIAAMLVVLPLRLNVERGWVAEYRPVAPSAHSSADQQTD